MVQKLLVRQFFIILATACSLVMLKGTHRPAYAETQSIVIEMPVYGQVISSNLTAEAESLVSSAINNQFGQNSALTTVQVVVVIHRNGEIIPVLTTTASRGQWQENPQVQAWTSYYGASYALLQRHEQDARIATSLPLPGSSPVRPTAVSNPEASFQIQIDRAAQIDNAFDSGTLTGQSAQNYLSDLD